jgi:endonuclease VIII
VPEGPEIRRAADAVERVLAGRRVVEVRFGLARLRRYRGVLEGSTVTSVDTRGKAMLTRFDNDLTLYSHNQLYGRWYISRRGEYPDTGRSLRVALHTATHSALLYSASDIDVLTDEEIASHPLLSKLGPDILDRRLTVAGVSGRLCRPDFRNRALASLYLDQRFLAGIGNYLRSEILFARPGRRAGRPLAGGDRQAGTGDACRQPALVSHGGRNRDARSRAPPARRRPGIRGVSVLGIQS